MIYKNTKEKDWYNLYTVYTHCIIQEMTSYKHSRGPGIPASAKIALLLCREFDVQYFPVFIYSFITEIYT